MKSGTEARFALAQLRLAGPQLRLILFSLTDVHSHGQHMRHVAQLNDLRGQQHRARFSLAIVEAAFSFDDGAGFTQVVPERFAISLMFPQF